MRPTVSAPDSRRTCAGCVTPCWWRRTGSSIRRSRAMPSGLSAFSVERFSGLNVRDDPEEVGASGAIDLLNVDFDQRGRVRSRGGLVNAKTFAGSTSAVYPLYAFGSQLIVGALDSGVAKV